MHITIRGIPATTPASAAAPNRQPTIELIDNPFAPEIFATSVAGFAVVNGVVQMTLDSTRCDHSRAEPVLERVVVGRMTLTVAAAQALVATLNTFLEQQGLSPSKACAAGSTFQ